MKVIILLYTFVLVYAKPKKADNTLEDWQDTHICNQCKCQTVGRVDCANQGLIVFFPYLQWKLVYPLQPIIVDLSENKFPNVTSIAELPLQVLNLSRCGVEFIESASFRDLQQMTTLDLSHNQFTSDQLMPNAFEGRMSPDEYEPLTSMRTLSLAYNELHSLHRDLFEHLSELTELDLSGNPLTTIDPDTLIAISSLPKLKVLNMRSCQLTELPDNLLSMLRHLERLDISDNQLTAVPQQLEEAKNLVYLNLNQNPITELDVTSKDNPGFPCLPKLKELHMSDMTKLRRIGADALAGLKSLEVLHLSHNPQLSSIDPVALARPGEEGEIFHGPPVKELYLQSNNLSKIDSHLLPHWDLVDHVDLSDNPLLCDCSTQWMVDHLVPTIEATSANASRNLVCAEPPEMTGTTMQHLHDTHQVMRCGEIHGHFITRAVSEFEPFIGNEGSRDITLTGDHEFTRHGGRHYTFNGNYKVTLVGNNQFNLIGDNQFTQTGNHVFTITGNSRFYFNGNNQFVFTGDNIYTLTGDNEFILTGNNQFVLTGNNRFTLVGNNYFKVTGNNKFTINGNNVYTITGKHFNIQGNNQLTINGVRRDDLLSNLP